MLQNLRNRAGEEKGFTLIELLVVILIIGILAAIALPTFLGQKSKGQDAEAKSNVRNAVSHVESCAVDKGGVYDASCDNDALVGTGLTGGTANGQVNVVVTDGDTYEVTGYSHSGEDFSYKKDAGVVTRNKASGGTW